MDVERWARPVAMACRILTGLGAVYAAASALTGWEPAAGPVVQALLHLSVLVLLTAVGMSGAGGRGRAARAGVTTGAIGFLLLAVAELTFPLSPAAGDQIFDVAPVVAGIGVLVAGVAVVVHRAWRGWHRATLLVAGLWTFVVLAPATVVSGGPPAPVALWAIAGWELCFALTAATLAAEATVRLAPAVA